MRPLSPRARRPWDVAGAIAAAGTFAAMVATPLARRGGDVRRLTAHVVVSGLFATTLSRTAQRWGSRRALATMSAVSVATAAVEAVGSRRGVPFGRYTYTSALAPQVGGVPAIVPLAWAAMSVPAREAAHAALGARSQPWSRVIVGSLALTAWDLFLDPQMVGEGYWRWARRGRYRGIPLSNFAGWLVTGAVVMAALERALPPAEDEADAGLVAVYASMASMETLGFAAFFRDRLVATVGGAAMLPLAGLAVRAAVRRR